MKTALITGSSGLVGSECVRHFARLDWRVYGLDSNARREFFGPDGDTSDVRSALLAEVPTFAPLDHDIRQRITVAAAVSFARPDLIIHAAAQPSHDYAAQHPFEDFEVNALGTLNLLEAARQYAPEAPFVFLSTNKVYGDAPNQCWQGWVESETRYHEPIGGWRCFSEFTPIDASTHSLFGCSKLAADLYVQEYGRYFGLNTVCFRCGCLTGGAHAGAEQHGFLAYLAKCCREGRPYKVYGHKGKQVRDQLHAADVARACELFAANPKPGEVYNLGGGRDNSISVIEAIASVERLTGQRLDWEYVDQPRKGDHICWITDTGKFRRDYPEWRVTRTLDSILEELCVVPASVR